MNYYTRFANYFDLGNCTVFGQAVQSASWDEDRNLWVIVSKNVSTECETTWTADMLIQAVGTYNRKKFPNLPGKDYTLATYGILQIGQRSTTSRINA